MPLNNGTVKIRTFKFREMEFQVMETENCFDVEPGQFLRKAQVRELFDNGVNIVLMSGGGGRPVGM